MKTRAEITRLLEAWSAGEAGALDRLVPAVLPELRQLARGWLARERRGHSLQVTDLVQEAYLRLVAAPTNGFDSRGHFFAFAARLVRGILVDHARARGRVKRGGHVELVALEAVGSSVAGPSLDLDTVLLVDELLLGLEQRDPRQSRVVELRFFAGLTLKEIAEAMGVSLATVERLWSVGRRRLARRLERADDAG